MGRTVIVPDRVRLPLRFDAAALAPEVRALAVDRWRPHFNTAIFEGDWDGVALRSPGGGPAELYTDPTASDFADTDVLAGCPNLALALARFHCPLKSVRLLALGPGGVIKEHRDYWLAFEDGEVRLHVPILTNPGVDFFLAGRRVDLAAGECWYLNLNRLHRVTNRSPELRVHLVVDCVVNEWLAAMITAYANTAS